MCDDVDPRRTLDLTAVAQHKAVGSGVSRAQLTVAAVGFALLPEDVLGRGLVVVVRDVCNLFDLLVLEHARTVSREFVGGIAEFAGVELTLLRTVVAVVRVFGHLALRFFVLRHVVDEVAAAVDLESLEGRLRVERPALFELAGIAPVATPRVLHDPEACAVLVVAPAEAFDRVAAGRSTLVCRRFVDSGADAVHLRLDGHADGHRPGFNQVGLDLGGCGQRHVFGALAATAHFFRVEVIVVLQSAPLHLSVLNRTSISLRVCRAVVGVGAGSLLPYGSHLVVDAAFTFARRRTASLAECVGAAAVPVGVAFFSGEPVFSHLVQSLANDAAVAPLAYFSRWGAVEQIFFRKVGVLVALILAVRFRILDCIRVRDCVGHRKTPARAALSLVHHWCETAVLFLSQVEELRQTRVLRLVYHRHRFHVFMLTKVTQILILVIQTYLRYKCY